MNHSVLTVGLFILVLAFFLFNSPDANPSPEKITPPPQAQQAQVDAPSLFEGYCQTPDPGSAPTFIAPADNVLKQGDDDIDRSAGRLIEEPKHCGQTRNQIGKDTTYRLIRKNVPMTANEVKNDRGYLWDDSSCHFQSADKLDISIDGIDTSKFKVYYPQISGEISLDRMLHSRSRDVDSSYMYFIDYGLVFLLHLNPDGSFTELKGVTMGGDNEVFYIADIYQDTESPGRGDVPPEALSCDTSVTATGPSPTSSQGSSSVLEPGQEGGLTDQLQLKFFVFGTPTKTSTGGTSAQIVNGWGVHCKPAVYLYPERKQLVNVKVTPKGELTYTDPPYNPDTGWTVWANPYGGLFNSGDNSPINQGYLYYESKLLDSEIKKPETGWVIKKSEMERLFNEILPKLGLNEKEEKDFKDYWLSKLPESNYYFVGLIEKDQRDYLEKLDVTPNPDTSIRFSLFFEMLDQPKEVTAPTINTPERNGFTLVDWGGMMKLHPGTPFTCSQ